MRVNKRQELYFATVVFILLTVYFFDKGLDNFAAAAAIEENCTDECNDLGEELIEGLESSGVRHLVISVIMGGLALFFWPPLTEEEKEIRQDLKDEIAEREKNRINLSEKRKEAEKVRFKEAYISGDLSKIGPRDIVRYRKYATWAGENKELEGQKEDDIRGLNENSDESE